MAFFTVPWKSPKIIYIFIQLIHMLSLSFISENEWIAFKNCPRIYSGVEVFNKDDIYMSQDYGVGFASTKE